MCAVTIFLSIEISVRQQSLVIKGRINLNFVAGRIELFYGLLSQCRTYYTHRCFRVCVAGLII